MVCWRIKGEGVLLDLAQVAVQVEVSAQAVYKLMRDLGNRKWLETVLNLGDDTSKGLSQDDKTRSG